MCGPWSVAARAATPCHSFWPFSVSTPRWNPAANCPHADRHAWGYHFPSAAFCPAMATGSATADSISPTNESTCSFPFFVKAGEIGRSPEIAWEPPQNSFSDTGGEPLCFSAQTTSHWKFVPRDARTCRSHP